MAFTVGKQCFKYGVNMGGSKGNITVHCKEKNLGNLLHCYVWCLLKDKEVEFMKGKLYYYQSQSIPGILNSNICSIIWSSALAHNVCKGAES